MSERFELWRCNDNKNGVKDTWLNAYYLDEEVVHLLNALHKDKEHLRIRKHEQDNELIMLKQCLRRIISGKKVEDDFREGQR